MQVGTVTGGGAQDAGVRIEAVLYPACLCGRPWTDHRPADGACQGYTPSGPVVNFGTRAYAPRPSLRWLRRVGCRLAWRAEAHLQHWRERMDGTAT